MAVINLAGQGKMEGTALHVIIFYPNITPMAKHNVFGYRKPQPCALHASNAFIVNLLEFVKYLLVIFNRYSDARVRYADLHERIDVINAFLPSETCAATEGAISLCVIVIMPPDGVNLMALLKMLSITCAILLRVQEYLRHGISIYILNLDILAFCQ